MTSSRGSGFSTRQWKKLLEGLAKEELDGSGWPVCWAVSDCSFFPSFHPIMSMETSSVTEWTEESFTLYASVLASLSVSPKNTRHRLTRHANFLLFLVLCVYVYRDLVPLATFSGVPADLGEGRILWAKMALLFVTAVIIPLFTPRQYIPVDPLALINPEQTASIFSFAFFFFLDRIVFLAYRESQLQEEELYPLCDSDASAHLTNTSFKARYLKKSHRHIFFGLMRIFHREFTILAGLLVLRVLSTLSGPFAMNRLLQYIETQDQGLDNVVRPWVWISLILLGPVAASLVQQLYIFINTRTLVRTEAIITQLIFTHSLRTRMKAETTAAKDVHEDSSIVEGPSTASSGSDADSRAKTVTPENGEGSPLSKNKSATVQASTSSVTSKSSEPSKREVKNPEAKKSQGSLVGKINICMSDGHGLGDSRDFLFLVVFIPLQLILGIWFLYVLLGWSVWVGVGSIVVLAPLPGYMAKLVQSTQKERLKHTDERVQSVSEAVNVFRMVKLFGWEEKMKARIEEKRDGELSWIRKRRIIDMANGTVTTMTLTYATYSKFANKDFCLIATQTELLDAFDKNETPDERIGFRNATFSWSNESDGSPTHSRQFQLKIDGEVIFRQGRINLVVGPTGSGEGPGLLCEMHSIPSSPDSWYNLPRSSGVAYAAQESWVLNETIRSNITFDTPFDEERYKKVLYQCALEPDLALFQAGDQTEVGEKDLTLSGGQKARLTLARAVYSTANILLLDDVLAALDVHTAQWVVEKCLGGDLVEGKTHNVALTQPIADFVVSFGSDGRMHSQGVISEITKPGPLAAQLQQDKQVLAKEEKEVDAEAPTAKPSDIADGKLIVAEEIQLGHVSGSALKMYFAAMGGRHPIFFFTFFFGAVFVQQGLVALRTWQLGYWAKQYDHVLLKRLTVSQLFETVAIVVISTIGLSASFICLVFAQSRASKVIHVNLVASVLGAPWFDVTPTSRIIARVTNDVRTVDDALASEFWPLTSMITSVLAKFVAVVIYSPVFFFPGALVGVLGAWVGQIYMSGQLPVKRMMSNSRAPVLAQYVSTPHISIRAFGAESRFSTESLARIDRYTRAARNYYNLNRWVSIRVDLLGAIFSAGLATYLVYYKHASAADSGFLLNMAITYINDFEVKVTLTSASLERIQGYINIEHEKPATEEGKPPAYWPASGDLRVEGLSARYSEDGPMVLQDISFHIKSGERVGVVGRTGSGKSSLTLSLLRCIPTQGSVKYDGRETSTLNLDALRSSITIIPQPELLSGSLRANLDPFGQYGDGRITLDSTISTGGTNLSVGQRQIFALARAIVRKSKILILDEDYKTDSIIQTSLRQELRGDISLITVAHRLQTIMDADKIMVLDAGRIVEFDSPQELLKIVDGKLRAWVEESGDREALYAMARAERIKKSRSR
ncbi:P-loop containing nucleoside triphosphate hydrolase protein [Mycena olivaceomarginata]|nr:P-loop containing nucleoside triphosphate hydrolase protein [Mycena olivaceomarginata]